MTLGPSPLRFGRVELLPVQRQLRVDGIPMAVGARALDVLLALIEHRSRVLSKNELLDLAWPGLVVEEGNLKVQVSALRKLIGAQAIATIPARGYRFAQSLDDDLTSPAVVSAQARRDGAVLASPWQDSSLAVIGRDDDLAALLLLLRQHRVVTVTGAGGIGKTTLAVAAASAIAQAFVDGSVRVELADVVDPKALPMAIAQALQLPPHPTLDSTAQLIAALRNKHLLLVIDNAEHVVAAAAQLAHALVDGTHHLHLLVTSQVPLHLAAEHVFRLGPLAVPDAGTALNDAVGYGAVALFAERARAADRHFVVGAGNLATVVEICRSLDGLALAIELAAARLPLLGVQGLAHRLDEQLRLLGGGSVGPRGAPTRQQTLRMALDWSHGLLSATECVVFRRLGVFVGGFTLGLAATVAGDAALDEWDVIDTLGALVDRSLVAVDVGELPRYRLLESARAYALERLEDAAELMLIRRRHAQALCAHVEEAEQSLWTTPEVTWLALHAPELGNLRAALDWTAREDPALAVALLAASFPLFACLALTRESRQRSAPLVDRLAELCVSAAVSAPIAARFLRACSWQLHDISVPVHHDFALRAVQGFRDCGDVRGLYESLYVQAIPFQTFLADAQAAVAEMQVIEQPQWPRTVRALACIARSRVANGEKRMDANRAALEAALALLEGSGADRLIIVVLANLADHVLLMGPTPEAVRRGEELVALLRRMRRFAVLPLALCNLANAYLQDNNTAAARRVLGDAFAHMREQQWLMLRGFGDVYALLAACEARFSDAARLLGWADEVRKLRGERQRNEARCREEAGRRVAAALGAAELQSLMAGGVAMAEEGVCQTTLSELS